MLTDYIRAAMQQSVYTALDDDEGWVGEIPPLQGLWASAPTRAECEIELASVLEGWLLLGFHLHQPIPILNGIDLNPSPEILTEVA